MKTKTPALGQVPSQNQWVTFRPFINEKNKLTSQLLGCEVKNKHIICFTVISLLVVLTLFFASEPANFGWAAFCGLSAICVAYALRDLFAGIEE